MPVAATYINELSRAHGAARFFMLYELISPSAFSPPRFWERSLCGLWLERAVPHRHSAGAAHHVSRFAPAGIAALADPARGACRSRSDHQEPGSEHRQAQSGCAQAISAASFAQKSRWSELFSPFYRNRTLIVWVIWATAYGVDKRPEQLDADAYNTVYHLPLRPR